MMDKKRKVDSEFGPGTIESDDEVENYSEAESDEETFRTEEDKKKDDFYEGFMKDGDYTDTWDTILGFLKPKKARVSINEKVAKILNEEKEAKKRKKEFKKKNASNGDIQEESGSDSDVECLPDEDFDPIDKDIIRLRDTEAKRIERISSQPVKKKSKAAIQQEEEDVKFFENAVPCMGDTTFLEMNFSRPLIKAIDHMGYHSPTPIQATTIPVALQGRDICGCAATGTGKTAAYMLPILERLLFKPSEDAVTRVLVVVPTRELGIQVFEVTKELAKFTTITTCLCVGGLDVKIQETSLREVPDIVVATPGRLIDHLLNAPNFHISEVEILVLDEADRMLEENFEKQMKEIMRQCATNRQTMLFSATMTTAVKELALVSLKNPVKIFINQNTEVAQNLRQEFIRLRKGEENHREAVLAYLVLRYFKTNTIVFSPTKVLAHRLHVLLVTLGISCSELHGDLKQTERVLALKKFKDQEVDVIVATDVAARGLDIKGVKTIINFTLPRNYSQYVHRVGRTARAGRCGRSISIAGEKEFNSLKEIRKNSKTALYERVLDKEIFVKLKAKVQSIKPVIERVLEEEQAERQLQSVEKHLENLEQKLDTNQKERLWMTPNKPPKKPKKLKLKGRQGKPENKEKEDESTNNKTMKFKEQRIVGGKAGKGKQKFKKIRGTGFSPGGKPRGSKEAGESGEKKAKKKSSFSKELTGIGKKSVGKFRSGGNKRQGGFKPRKK